MCGVGLDEALTKVGGSQQRLEEAIRCKRVLVRTRNGLSIYFFPRLDYVHMKQFSHEIDAEKQKAADEDVWAEGLQTRFGHQWFPGQPSLEQGPDQQLPSLPLPCSAGEEGTPAEEDVEKLSQGLDGLNRQQSMTLRLITQAESAMSAGMHMADLDLMQVNVDQAKIAAEHAEELATTLSKAKKFGRISLEGGWSSQNCKVLADQAQESSRRLSQCGRLIKALLPIPGKNS